MRISIASSAPKEWDQFVSRHPQATAYHRAAAVEIGRRAFGLETFYLSATDDAGNLAGVLPLVEQSSLLFGRFLSSVPFFTYGGILANETQIAAALADAAGALGHERRAKHVELRHSAPLPRLPLADRTDKVSMVLQLPADEAALSKQLGSKLRSQIKRAEREEPTIHWGGPELLADFYQVFAHAMHDLGTPVYPRRFFDCTLAALHGAIDVLVIRVKGRAEAAAIVIRHGDRIEVPWAACSRAGKRGALNMRMYWEMLKLCVARGVKSFDFGRSTVDSGTYRFKSQWGAQPLQLHWYYWLPRGADIPRLNQSNPKYELAAKVWRRLPLWSANLMGPWVVRNLP
ncbi:MAG TPA: FemAB family XrtA/PEP-CTERM system-associated protein [Steroidobacteraceae bacterium]|nr:FemAB family XrtA/PEP-CTERM system-associated protein [Steroidobacteraceae bacterium]